MLNSDLPNINSIGNGSEVRAVVAKLVGYAETNRGSADRAKLANFFRIVAQRLGYVETPVV